MDKIKNIDTDFIKIDNEIEKIFIHFENRDKCLEFINTNKNIIVFGHRCCSGKGVHIISRNGIIVKDYKDINDLRAD